MNNLKSTILIIFTFLAVINSQAQGVNKALQEFEQTEFMVQFEEMKKTAERTIYQFKKNSAQYDAYDVKQVEIAYDKTATKYNQLLNRIKADLLDKKKMKYIEEYPDSYSKGLELDLYQLKDYYSNQVQQELANVTGEADNSGFLALLPEILSFANTFIQHIVSMRKEAKKFTNELLEKRLIKPNQFLLWEEITVAGQ